MIKNLRVTVGIPAFNEEKTIGILINSILTQEQKNFSLLEIIVYSDASTDKTVEKIKKIYNDHLKIIVGNKRVGSVQGIAKILKEAHGDIVILFDADITLINNKIIFYLVEPFLKDKKVGLVAGNRKLLKGNTFIGKATQTNIESYDKIAAKLRGGSNPYNCHGAALALSKKIVSSIHLRPEVVSIDTFLYFSCLRLGMKFVFVKKAKVWIKTVNNLHEAILQFKRYLPISYATKKYFGNFLKKEYSIPLTLRLRYLIEEFIHFPLEFSVISIIKLYCKFTPNAEKKPIWTIAKSTKGGIIA